MGRSARPTAALSILILAAQPAAARWTVTPDITLRETYTDNVFIGSPTRESDFVTQVTPGIRIDGSGPRLRASFDYRPTALVYKRNSDQDRVAQNLFGNGTLEAVERFFFVDATGSITQGFITPFGAQPADITNVTPNRAEVRTFSLSPYVHSTFGRAFTYELRNRNTWTNTNNNALADIHSSGWNGYARSPTDAVTLFGWALEYDQNRIAYTTLVRPDYESKLFRGRLYFQPTADLRLNASAGRERNNYILQQEKSYYIRGVGALWKPGPRTSAEAQYERRYFGPYRLARFDHRTRLTAWSAAYTRNASTYQQQLLTLPPGNTAALLDAIFSARIPDPVQRQAAVEQFLTTSGTPPFLANSLAFYTQQVFLQERLEGSFGILGARNSITFTAFRGKSRAITDAAGTGLPDTFVPTSRITQSGFGVNVSHQLTPFTTLGANARRTLAHQEEPVTADTRNDFYAATVNHTLSPKTNTFAGLSYTRFVSPQVPSSSYGNARSAFVGLNHRF